jgi:hypothetical protein
MLAMPWERILNIKLSMRLKNELFNPDILGGFVL